ncbi:DUF6622 family protein [Clostridium sp. E02]|uniref:DUF6622 family protein n=1 Tax=Clostridium sp. E02 TaxID=2487134 RepID=UPI000F53482C|nr:DUF6622 family protein [Clostridium sp. E02]
MFIIEVLTQTPIIVWVLLVILIKRGQAATQDARISFSKMLLVPTIFIIWGLMKLFTKFAYFGESVCVYVVLAAIGSMVGYSLYSRFRKVYKKENDFYRTGTYLPLMIILVNFSVKYCLNVAVSIQPFLYNNFEFNLLYSIACGFSVGLFIGGLLQAYVACSRYEVEVNFIS